jgi:class 3 adenylate cyclase
MTEQGIKSAEQGNKSAEQKGTTESGYRPVRTPVAGAKADVGSVRKGAAAMGSRQHQRVERRLAAILAAHVAGYSRLIETDEEGTLGRLKALRAEVIDPQIAGHKGRIVKTTGDGLLVEFVSVVDAVRCAAEVQAAMAERNVSLPLDRRIDFRIGIHQGDIVVEDGAYIT